MNRPLKQAPEGAAAAYTKGQYDLANRLIGTYTGYSPGNNDDLWTIGTNDKIFEQSLLTLDGGGEHPVDGDVPVGPGEHDARPLTSSQRPG